MGGADGYGKAMGMIDAVVDLFKNKRKPPSLSDITMVLEFSTTCAFSYS